MRVFANFLIGNYATIRLFPMGDIFGGYYMYHVIVIGAGAVGSATARELSRYSGKFLVLEAEEDVCSGTTKANSAIVHAGYDAVPGSKKALYNVRGSEMMEDLSKEDRKSVV